MSTQNEKSNDDINVDDILMSSSSDDDQPQSNIQSSTAVPIQIPTVPTPLEIANPPQSGSFTNPDQFSLGKSLTPSSPSTSQPFSYKKTSNLPQNNNERVNQHEKINLLDPSTSVDELESFMSNIPENFLDFENRNIRLFSHYTTPPVSHIEQRLQQHLYAKDDGKISQDGDVFDQNGDKIGSKLTDKATTSSSLQTNLFSLTKFTNISDQMSEKKQFTGVPISICTNHRFICIGTSLGFVWVFDHFQYRYGCLGTAKEHRQDSFNRGPIISLDLSPDGDHLFVAHRNGAIVIWDLLPKTITKVIDDFLLPANLLNQNSQNVQQNSQNFVTNILQILALPPPKSIQKPSEKSSRDDKSHLTFLLCNTNGGLAYVNIQKRFLVWHTDVKWVMNNPEKPILQVSLLPQAPISLISTTQQGLDYSSGLTRSMTTLGQHNATDLARSTQTAQKNLLPSGSNSRHSITSPQSHTPIIVEDHTLISLVFEERTMVVALEPQAKVLGVIPREFTTPAAAAAAGLKFHPIIRPFGPVSSSWRASRPITSASTSGATGGQSDGGGDEEEGLEDGNRSAVSSPVAGANYTHIYEDVKSYYSGSRPYSVYTNYPLLAVSRGTLLQLFTAFDPSSLPEMYQPEVDPSKPAPPLPISMEKIHIVIFPFEIISTAWINDSTLLIFTQNNPGVPLSNAPPNPTGATNVYAFDAIRLEIFEKFSVPTSIAQPIAPYRTSQNQSTIIHDRSYSTTIATSMGQNAVSLVLGQTCALSGAKMLSFLDRITSISEQDWILALAIAYDTWLKAKKGGSQLLASRNSQNSAQNNDQMPVLQQTPSHHRGPLGENAILQRTNSMLNGGLGNNIANLTQNTMLTPTGVLLMYDASFLSQCSLLGFIPQYENIIVQDGVECYHNNVNSGNGNGNNNNNNNTGGIFLPGNPIQPNKNDKKNENLNYFFPSGSILDTNIFILQNSFLENNSNTIAAMSLCDKIMDLIVYQTDLQIKRYSHIITQYTAKKEKLFDETDQTLQSPQNIGQTTSGNFGLDDIESTQQLNDQGAFSNESTTIEQSFENDIEAGNHALGMITVAIQTIIDLTLKFGRSDVLLKLILPRFVKANNSILAVFKNLSQSGAEPQNSLLKKFHDDPSIQPMTIFLSHLFKVIMASHRNDMVHIDGVIQKHIASQQSKAIMKQNQNIDIFQNSNQNQHFHEFINISTKLKLNQNRFLIIDDFVTDLLFATLISQTKFHLWLLREDQSLQTALHSLHFNNDNYYSPSLLIPSSPPIPKTTLTTFQLNLRLLIAQLRLAVINLHPIYMALISSQSPQTISATSRPLNQLHYTPVYPLNYTNKNLLDVQQSFTYPLYTSHHGLLQELYLPNNFIHQSPMSSSISSMSFLKNHLNNSSNLGQNSTITGQVSSIIHSSKSLTGLGITQNLSALVLGSSAPLAPQTTAAAAVVGLQQQQQQQREKAALKSQLNTQQSIISNILQLIGPHLHQSYDLSYIIQCILSLGLPNEYLHITQGLFSFPLIAHRLLQHLGYITPSNQLPQLPLNSQLQTNPLSDNPGKIYTTFHYLLWYFTFTSPYLNPYLPSLHAPPKTHPLSLLEPTRSNFEEKVQHPLLTLIFFNLYSLSHGISIYNNVNLKFMLPRLQLHHIRYAQQQHRTIFNRYCEQYDAQQLQMAQISNSLNNSSNLTQITPNLSPSAQFQPQTFSQNSSSSGDFVNANTGQLLTPPPTSLPQTHSFGLATGYGNSLIANNNMTNTMGQAGVVDALLQYSTITTTTLYRAQIMSFLFSQGTILPGNNVMLPHLKADFGQHNGKDGKYNSILLKYPYLYLFLNELDVSTNFDNNPSITTSQTESDAKKESQNKYNVKTFMEKPTSNDKISLPTSENPFFSLLCDLLGYPNWVVLSATAGKGYDINAHDGSSSMGSNSNVGGVKLTEVGTNLQPGSQPGQNILAKSFLGGSGSSLPSLKQQPQTPSLPHIKPTVQTPQVEKNDKNDKNEGKSAFGGWFSKMTDLVTGNTTQDESTTTPAQGVSGLGQQLRQQQTTPQVGTQPLGNNQAVQGGQNSNFDQNNPSNLVQNYQIQPIEQIYQTPYTSLLPTPLPSMVTIIHALTWTIFSRPNIRSNSNPYFAAFNYALEKNNPNATLLLSSGVDDEKYFYTEIFRGDYKRNNIVLLLSLTYHSLLTGVITLYDLPECLLVSLVSFACLSPDEHLLSILFINTRHSNGYFSLSNPFSELTAADLALLQTRPNIPPTQLPQPQLASRNSIFLPHVSPQPLQDIHGRNYDKFELQRLNQISSYLHTQRELLLLSLIPYIGGTASTSTVAQTITPPQPYSWTNNLTKQQKIQFNVTTLLTLAELVDFSRALLSIYIQQKNFEKVLSSFLFITQPLLQATQGNTAGQPDNNVVSVRGDTKGVIGLFTGAELATCTPQQSAYLLQIGSSFDDGGLLDEGEKYDADDEDDEDGDDEKINAGEKSPQNVQNVQNVQHNQNKKLILHLSKELIAYISEELFSPLKIAFGIEKENGKSNSNLGSENNNDKIDGNSPPENTSKFAPFLKKLSFTLKRVKQLLQIYPLSVVGLYIVLTQALLHVENEIQFQSIFFTALYDPKVNGSDKSTLFIFLKHLLYCYDLHIALNRTTNDTTQNDDNNDDILGAGSHSGNSNSNQVKNSKQKEKDQEKLQKELQKLLSTAPFLCRLTPNKIVSVIQDSSFTVPSIASGQYIELLCQYEPKRVYHYVSTKQNYSLDLVLNLCKKYKIHDATAYILERTGDLKGALDLLFKVITQEAEGIQSVMHQFLDIFKNRTMVALSPFFLHSFKPYVFSEDQAEMLAFEEEQQVGPYGRRSMLTVTPMRERRAKMPSPPSELISNLGTPPNNGNNTQNKDGKNVMMVGDYLQKEKLRNEKDEFSKIDFGKDNDVAHVSTTYLLQQYQFAMKNAFFFNQKIYSSLIYAIPVKLRKYITYPVQMAISLCKRASEQGMVRNTSRRRDGLDSIAKAHLSQGIDSPNNVSNINTHLEDWESLWIDLLLLLIRIQRSVAQTRFDNFNTNVLPQLHSLPHIDEYRKLENYTFLTESIQNSQFSSPTPSKTPQTSPTISKLKLHASTPTLSPSSQLSSSSSSSSSSSLNLTPPPLMANLFNGNDIVLFLLHSIIVSNISRVLNSMLEYIPADKILIIAMKPYQNDTLSSFSNFFTLLFDSILYEVSLRHAAKRLLNRDYEVNTVQLHRRNNQCLNYTSPLQRLIKIQSKATCQVQNPILFNQLSQRERKMKALQRQFSTAPMLNPEDEIDKRPLLCLHKATLCAACAKPIQNDDKVNLTSHVIVFGCGHTFHDDCCDGIQTCIAEKSEDMFGMGILNLTLNDHNDDSQQQQQQQQQQNVQCPKCLQRGLAQQNETIKKSKKLDKDDNEQKNGLRNQEELDLIAMTGSMVRNFKTVNSRYQSSVGYSRFDAVSHIYSILDDSIITNFDDSLFNDKANNNDAGPRDPFQADTDMDDQLP